MCLENTSRFSCRKIIPGISQLHMAQYQDLFISEAFSVLEFHAYQMIATSSGESPKEFLTFIDEHIGLGSTKPAKPSSPVLLSPIPLQYTVPASIASPSNGISFSSSLESSNSSSKSPSRSPLAPRYFPNLSLRILFHQSHSSIFAAQHT